MKSKLRHILGYALLYLLIGYLGLVIGCYHVHVIDGHIIAHSHILPSSSGTAEEETLPKHTHSLGQLYLLQQYSDIVTNGSLATTDLPNAPEDLLYHLFAPIEVEIAYIPLLTQSQRAPPLA